MYMNALSNTIGEDFVSVLSSKIIFKLNVHVQYGDKSLATCKKIPYIINQNHIFFKDYCEVISGCVHSSEMLRFIFMSYLTLFSLTYINLAEVEK